MHVGSGVPLECRMQLVLAGVLSELMIDAAYMSNELVGARTGSLYQRNA